MFQPVSDTQIAQSPDLPSAFSFFCSNLFFSHVLAQSPSTSTLANIQSQMDNFFKFQYTIYIAFIKGHIYFSPAPVFKGLPPTHSLSSRDQTFSYSIQVDGSQILSKERTHDSIPTQVFLELMHIVEIGPF